MFNPPTKDAMYYWDGVSFLVDDCLFKVPRRRFALSSKTFAASHLLDVDDWHLDLDGATESRPIVLEGASAAEFRSLLKLLFPVYTSSVQFSFSKTEWLNVLKLSTIFHFAEFRKLAISKLDEPLQADPIERVKLARQFHISTWLVSGFEALVSQDTAISEDQAIALDLLTAVRLYAIRDAAAKAELQVEKERNTRYRHAKHLDVRPEILAAFDLEIKSMKDMELEHLTEEEKEDPEWRRLRLTRDEEVLQLRSKIEAEELQLKDEEGETEKKRLCLEGKKQRLAKILDGNTKLTGDSEESE
ncbi:hypothetical protein BKA70DRAFT_1100709 [Coprinopsis sp. MPI-PUGE-AT-0042]|nr:hypothetical protein BKA70DRAFT_1100709 [Coprinopsis sp. MPI-PUGE-AT-0042]